jgi:hypothetical protein
MERINSFSDPVVLLGGRKVSTISEARNILLSLPTNERQTFHWRYAAELLDKAIYLRGEKYAVRDARAQFERALMLDGRLSTHADPQPTIRAIRERAMRAKSRLKASA